MRGLPLRIGCPKRQRLRGVQLCNHSKNQLVQFQRLRPTTKQALNAAISSRQQHSAEGKTMDSRAVMGWILEYLAHVFWDEFKEQNTLDGESERQLFQGILCQKMDISTERCRLVNFLLLLVRLVDGQDVNAMYKDDQQDTPLEDALGCFDSVVLNLQCDCTQNEIDQFRDIIKEQAVIVCCRLEDFDKAHRVFLSLFGDSVPEDASKADSRVKVQRQLQSFIKAKKVSRRFLDLHTYEDFLQEVKPFLQKIYNTFSPPMLLTIQRKAEQKRGTNDEIDDEMPSSSVVDASSKADEGGSSRRSSPLKGLRELSRSWLDRGDHRVSNETSKEDELPTSDPQNENNSNLGTPIGLRVRSPLKRKCGATNGHSSDSDTGVYSLALLKAATPSLAEEDWADIEKTSDLTQRDSSPMRKTAEVNDSSDASAPALDQSQSPIAGLDPQCSNNHVSSSPAASTPKRGRSIRDQQYQPNRNMARDISSTPERAADSAEDQISWSGSEITIQSNNSFPTLTSPRVRRSLDPSQAFRQLSKKKQFWSDEECQLLKKAVKRFGPGKWSEMRLAYDFNGRTNVNLKDKWRNMVKNGEA